MRIAFLTTDLSFPPEDGRMLRTFNVLRGLADRHIVHLVCFDQRHGTDPLERRRVAEARLRELCESVDVYEVPSKRSRAGLLWAGASSLLASAPFSSQAYRSPAAIARLKAIGAANPLDVIHVENTLLGSHVADVPGHARVLVHHNVESELFAQRAASERHLLMRAFVSIEARKFRRFEREIGPRFGAHIACSADDAAKLEGIMSGARVCVVPNGVDLVHFRPTRSPRERRAEVVHVGGLNWPPNLQGARWLVDDVWPHVRQAQPDATLILVGRPGDAPVADWGARPGVVCLGEVEDVRPHFAAASVSVVPLHIGGGTRLKILNSWAMGTPVVSTTKGCQGLPGRDGETLLVADTAEDFARAVVRLLRSPELRDTLATAGRKLVEAEYGWDRIVDQTEEAYRRAAYGGIAGPQ
jgi:glycosyltransferase involved in cell wall biosynthesis